MNQNETKHIYSEKQKKNTLMDLHRKYWENFTKNYFPLMCLQYKLLYPLYFFQPFWAQAFWLLVHDDDEPQGLLDDDDELVFHGFVDDFHGFPVHGFLAGNACWDGSGSLTLININY